MIRATLCLAVYLTMIVALAHGLSTGNGGPLIAASLLGLLTPPALRHQENAAFR
jgi:hypothetical protein